MDSQAVIEATRRWIADIVIGLNLCPFARRVFEGDRIRYVVTEAADEGTLLRDLTSELKALAATDETGPETTLLIHPRVLNDFLDYNDFLEAADQLVAVLDLDGVIQVASFHPDYHLAETQPADVENYTNRSPYPMLHLLKEDSFTWVADYPGGLDAIPERNIETLRALGRDAILARLRKVMGE